MPKKDYTSMKEVPVELLTPKTRSIGNDEGNPEEAEEAMPNLHQEAITGKGKRVARLNKKRKMKAYKEIKVDVPKNVDVSWFGTHKLKTKDKLTPQQINKAKRAQRIYNTGEVNYTYGKAQYGKNHSRAKVNTQAMAEANS